MLLIANRFGPITSVLMVAIYVMFTWRPTVSVPQSPFRPTWAARPNRRLPWPSAPLSMAMPLSSTKNACRPPPRSSAPRNPMRDGKEPVSDGTLVIESPSASALVVWTTPLSTMP